MKLIIAGGRDYRLTKDDRNRLDELDHIQEEAFNPIKEVVSGGANGADADGEAWTKDRGIPVKIIRPDWLGEGRKAGPLRNAIMAQYADAVVLFPGSRGTQSMFDEATKAGIKIFDWRNG